MPDKTMTQAELENYVAELLAKNRELEILVSELQDNTLLLQCLDAAGVDNWDGFDEAVTQYQEIREAHGRSLQ